MPVLACLVLAAATAAAAGDEPGAGSIDSAGAATATGSGPLETEVVIETLVSEALPDGTVQKRFTEARRLDAGEEVHYTIEVHNPGKSPVQDVVVTKRLPYGLDFVAGSAVGPACSVELSTDGGVTFAPPAARPAAYTHVRWILHWPLVPGATALLRFRAIFR